MFGNSLFHTQQFAEHYVYVKKFGAKGNGVYNDGPAIKKAYEIAKNISNSAVVFESGKIYRTNNTFEITAKTLGNGSTIVPVFENQKAISFYKHSITVKDLTIKSPFLTYINVNKNNIVFDNCHIKGEKYFILMSLNGNGTKILNSSVINNHKKNQAFAVHSISSVNRVFIEGSKIKGAILFSNISNSDTGDHTFIRNHFTVNQSYLDGNFKNQFDAFTFRSINKVVFDNNIFDFTDVNRGFKFTDRGNADKTLSDFLPDNILFTNNTITSSSSNGKQLFDLYHGTLNFSFLNNKVFSKGHTVLFENKTATDVLKDRSIKISGNEIYFDFYIAFLKGHLNSKYKNDIDINNNTFYYTSDIHKNSITRKGQEGEIKFNFVFDIRDASSFNFVQNKIFSKKAPLNFGKKYFFNLNELDSVNIADNENIGNARLVNKTRRLNLFLSNNKVDTNLSEILDLQGDYQQSITEQNNRVNGRLMKIVVKKPNVILRSLPVK